MGIPYPITLDPQYSAFTMDNSIDHQLQTDGATDTPASESPMVYAQNPALPPSPSTEAIETLKRKDFSKIKIEKLLQAVININPYMVPWRQVTTYWKAVSQELHDNDTCLDCTHEVLKNKVMQLLAWVEV